MSLFRRKPREPRVTYGSPRFLAGVTYVDKYVDHVLVSTSATPNHLYEHFHGPRKPTVWPGGWSA